MTLKIIAIAALAFGCVTAAHAADRETVTVRVPVDGLDLSSPHGAEIALARISLAAVKVCGPAPDPRAIADRTEHRACLKTTIDSAVVAANNPVITALHTPAETSRLASVRP